MGSELLQDDAPEPQRSRFSLADSWPEISGILIRDGAASPSPLRVSVRVGIGTGVRNGRAWGDRTDVKGEAAEVAETASPVGLCIRPLFAFQATYWFEYLVTLTD